MGRLILALMATGVCLLADAAPALAHVVLATPGRDMNVPRTGLNRAAARPAGAQIAVGGDVDGDGGIDYQTDASFRAWEREWQQWELPGSQRWSKR